MAGVGPSAGAQFGQRPRDCEARVSKGHPRECWNYREGEQCSWWTGSHVPEVGVTAMRSNQDGKQRAGAGGLEDNTQTKRSGVSVRKRNHREQQDGAGGQTPGGKLGSHSRSVEGSQRRSR